LPKNVIGRTPPGAGSLSQADLVGISQKSCAVPEDLPHVQLEQRCVAPDKDQLRIPLAGLGIGPRARDAGLPSGQRERGLADD
jgi:hypothetical protein